MEKYYFDAPEKENPKESSKESPKNTRKLRGRDEVVEKITLDLLKEKIRDMDVLTELQIKSPYRATVLVYKNVGTTMFLASGSDNHFWLRANAVKMEEGGSAHKYHFVFD